MVISIFGNESNVGKTMIASMLACFYHIQAGHKTAIINPVAENKLESYFFVNFKKDFELNILDCIADPKLLPSAANEISEDFDIFSQHNGSYELKKEELKLLIKSYDTVVIDGYVEWADIKINVMSDNLLKQVFDERADLHIINRFDVNGQKLDKKSQYMTYEYYSSIKQYMNEQNFYQLFLKRQKATDHFRTVFTTINNFRC